jgi:hypothetical protein
VVERVADFLLPHLICEFLYDTAEKVCPRDALSSPHNLCLL